MRSLTLSRVGAASLLALPLLASGCMPRPSAALSPDGSRLVLPLGGSGRLRLMNADGSGLRALSGTESAHCVTWSPDGSRLLFARGSDRDQSAILYDLAAHRARDLGKDLRPPFAWKADGTEFAAFRRTGGEEDQPERWSVVGFRLPEVEQAEEVPLAVDAVNQEGTLLWLPGEGRIAFTAGNGGSVNVWLAEGGRARQITHTGDVIGLGVDAEDRLVWARAQPGANSLGVGLFAYDLPARTAVRLPLFAPSVPKGIKPRTGACEVRFSPDGARLTLLVLEPRRRSSLYLSDLTGRGLHPLLRLETPRRRKDQAGYELLPTASWSADSRRVAVYVLGKRPTVCLYDREGRPLKKIPLAGG